MSIQKSAALVALAVASLLFAGQAVAEPSLDQRQLTLDEGEAIVIGGSGPQIPAQVVKSGITGVLTQVALPLACEESSTPLVVQILDSGESPGTNVLSTQTISGVSDELEWRSVALATPPFMPKETSFAIALSSPGFCVIFGGPFQGDPYPRGNGWYQGPPNPPGIWALAGLDLGFRTYVERMCKVPSLLGLFQQEAQTLIGTNGCDLGRITRVFSMTVSAGQIVSQGQAEGTLLPPESRVDFVVSVGRQRCKVPNVRGKKLAAAKSAITKARCGLGKVRRVRSRKVKRGRVIAQSPTAGSSLVNRGKVNLVVSRGPAR